MASETLIKINEGLEEERTRLVYRALASYSVDTLRRFRDLKWIDITDDNLKVVENARHQLLSNPPAQPVSRKGF